MNRAMTAQHFLNEFLQTELHHTMGAYGVATRELERLDKQLDHQRHQAEILGEPGRKDALATVAALRADDLKDTLDINRQLREQDRDHPLPARPYHSPNSEPGLSTIVTARLANPIAEFYLTSIAALEAALDRNPYRDAPHEPVPDDSHDLLVALGHRLEVTHDPQRRVGSAAAKSATAQDAGRARKLKLERMLVRLAEAERSLGPPAGELLEPDVCVGLILGDSLQHTGKSGSGNPRDSLCDHPLHQVVISALIDGHLRMHHAEHRLAQPFGKTLDSRGHSAADIQAHLDASISLHTFAYVAARSMPWIFAEDGEERASVLARYRESCDRLTPPYCMWIARQVSLLALHRRGFAYWLQDEVELAYKDFYKLRRQVRQASRSLRDNVVFPPGARQFLDGLHALAEHHTGRIYQAEHAHDVALSHFRQAAARLRRLAPDNAVPSPDQADAQALLHNSRWRVRLLIGQGKAHYELGRLKASLLCNLEAWRCFLELLESERRASIHLETVDEVIEWLKLVVDDPDLDKAELRDRFEPLVNQFPTITRSIHLRSLAADIIARIGHALLILKLPDRANPKDDDDSLAYDVLSNAATLDPTSTPVGVDLLTISHRSPKLFADGLRRPGSNLQPIDEHWPGGGSEFETAARVIEYILQLWITDSTVDGAQEDEDVGKAVADRLLPAFTTHTDSSNVKLAQIYRYLMQGPRKIRNCDAAIEFVCARRYSSFFPFLPRPSAFRVRGGGYFVRIVDEDLRNGQDSFGIAIDPGPDYLDNLYRCGYGLADIDMVVVTHDHADHVAELDAMLALLAYRRKLGDDRFRPLPADWPDDGEDHDETPDARLLPIVGNDSICERYGFYDGTGSNAVLVLTFADLRRLTRPSAEPKGKERFVLLPPSMRFKPARTNHKDARGGQARGFTLSVVRDRRSASIGFTSDTGDIGLWPGSADVVVAHVSTVPMPDLRRMAGLEEAPAHAAAETERFQTLWRNARGREQVGRARHDPDDFLLRQLQFGFWSPAHRNALEAGDSGLAVSPLSPLDQIFHRDGAEDPPHLYLERLVALAERIDQRPKGGLLLVGELREELGSFRSRIASELNDKLFRPPGRDDPMSAALTADIGLALEICPGGDVKILCSTCDLDNDMTHMERFHEPKKVYEVCVKGEHEGVFYNCEHHNPQSQSSPTFVELVERYDVFGH